MRKLFFCLAAVFTIVLCLAGCKHGSDDDEVVYTSDCYINSAVLGTMKRTVYSKTVAGKDTSYQVSFSGVLYPLAVDQRAQTITNITPLPTGTHLMALTTFASQGLVVYTTAPVTNESVWTAYTTTDSIDYSAPLVIRVYAYDASSFRDYDMRLTVRTTDADNYTWQQQPNADVLEGFAASQIIILNHKPALLCTATDGTTSLVTPTDDETSPWVATLCTGIANADPATLQQYAGLLWMSTNAGQMCFSADGVNWTAADAELPLYLFAASESQLYATAADGIYCGDVSGNWQACEREADTPDIPTRLTGVAFVQDNGNSRVMAAGTADDATAQVWSLLEGSGEAWTLFSSNINNNYALPVLRHLRLLRYNGLLMAFGGNEKTAIIAYYSSDNGITWRKDKYFTMPVGFDNNATSFSITSEGEYLWVNAGQQVWKVRLNGYGE